MWKKEGENGWGTEEGEGWKKGGKLKMLLSTDVRSKAIESVGFS